ncbi:hypothetical protein BFW38_00550 [Terasakiispira papahanaumokuakeensis]|uniref:Pilus assembly protein TadE n=1 Tax=Terasakiispira papahanaumokuakeensis TaxID=197479 RepID=A0A1E2V6G6_9GAMM|nr:TadE family protein [Terasakiispira papahanaumokuakeensis]ODC02255.1 hypothetical protein BFW38_00550 [Terasakiispira papahanaumokuakeensis]
MRSRLWRLSFTRHQAGVTAVETALIFPILIFGIMMLFELARVGLMISIGGTALERSLQSFRYDIAFYEQGDSVLRDVIRTRMLDYGYGLLTDDALKIDVLSFDSLARMGSDDTEPDASSDEASSDDEAEAGQRDPLLPPVLTVTADIKARFMTPLPELFGLGNTFQYQFRQVLGNLTSELPESDED